MHLLHPELQAGLDPGSIDVTGSIAELADTLQRGDDREGCRLAITILRRWQWDRQLTQASRMAARKALTALRRAATG